MTAQSETAAVVPPFDPIPVLAEELSLSAQSVASVVKLIAEGHSSKEIAATLVISVRTVERHRANVLAKLGMRDRTELTRYAIRAGLIEP